MVIYRNDINRIGIGETPNTLITDKMNLQEIQDTADKLSPENFLTSTLPIKSKSLQLLKSLYDLTKDSESNLSLASGTFRGKNKHAKKKQAYSRTEIPLPKLITKDFDEDQIWEEIQLQNTLIYENLVSSVSKILSHKARTELSQANAIESNDEDDDGEFGNKEENENMSEEDIGSDTKVLKQQDEGDDDDNEFDGSESEEDEELEFDAKNDKVPETENERNSNLSTFEKKRQKIEENIQKLENEALLPKSWQLTGEVTAEKRPENSLLEEHLMYDHLLRQAPEITVKTTQRLEDIIRQRIKDQSWDDVIRKIKPIEDVSEYKKRLVLDAEKSKMSLTQIYEKEYLEKQKTDDNEIEEEQEPEKHQAIQKNMTSLFAKLDALSHFHYTPKMLAPEIKTITNAAAVTMEEVAQTAFSDATLLAPQEITQPVKGEIKGKAERSKTDRKRERRLKKKKQHLKRLADEEKARAKGLGLRNIKLAETVVKKSRLSNKNNEDGYRNNTKELKSSSAFFAKLQEQVSSHINVITKRKKSTDSKQLSAKKFKL